MKIRTVSLSIVAALAALVLFSSSHATATASASYSQVAVEQAFSSLNSVSMLADENYLAGDETQGRRSGTKGCELAAAYIARQFKGAGLVAPVNGSYYLPFPITTAVKLGGGNALSVTHATGVKAFAVGKDFIPLVYSSNAAVSGPVVFVGYGISAPDYKYDDYAGIDAKGKVVVVLRYQPQMGDDKSAFNGGKATRFADIRYKAVNAHQHGAAAMILVTGPAGGHQDEGNDLIKLKNDFTMGDEGLPVIMVTRPVADAILGKPIADAQKPIEDGLKPGSFAVTFTSADLTTDVVKEKGTTSDVIGYLPGNDPKLKDEIIVLGAHYDHLGFGGQGSLAPDQEGKIHHGADDNASGTTCVIEIAKALAKERANLRRTVVFMTFSGEEEGLLGSGYYAEHPLWPLKDTVAMLNVDMVGRLHENKLVVSGYKSATEFDGYLKEANARLGFKLAEDASGYAPSDQTSFLAKDIPVLFFFTGAHEDYHRPSDTVDKIDFQGLLRVAQYVLLVATDIDKADARPTFDKSSQGTPPSAGGGGGYGPYLGTIPDFGESPAPGVKLTGVRKDSPAEKAGLQAGDIIVKLGDAEIRGLYDLFNALQNHKPGDVVEIVYKRGDKTFTTKATLEKRKQE